MNHHRQSILLKLCGAAAVLILLAGFMASGIPSKTYAWVISVSASYTSVITGGYTTISWSAPSSDYCVIYGPLNVANMSGETCTTSGTITGGGGCDAYGNCQPYTYGPPYNTQCHVQVAGANGSVTAGPINTNYTYNVQCSNVSGGIGSSQGSGGAYVTVVPSTITHTTLNSFSASPASVVNGGASTLSYNGTPGTYGTGLYLVGGIFNGYVSGWSGSVSTGALTTSTTYNMYTEDSYYGQVLAGQITVPVV